MKTYNSTTGGHPLTNDDLLWLQSQFLEVTQELLCLLASTGSGDRLLAGGEIETVNPTLRNVNGGWLVWDGELIKFNGASLSGAGHVVVAKASANVPPSKIYSNSAVVWPYQEVAGQLQLTATSGNPTFFYLATALRFGVSPWTLALLGTPDWENYQPNPNLYHKASYRRLATGQIELRGQIEVGSIAAIATAFTLPQGFRPTKLQSFARSYADLGGALVSCWVEVDTNGDVNILGVPSTVGFRLSLDGIIFDMRT